MHESFWVGTSLGDLLFSGLTVNNAGAMVGACIFFCVFTILFESLKVFESKMRKDHYTRIRKSMQGPCAPGDRSSLLAANSSLPGPSNRSMQPMLDSPSQNPCLLKLFQVGLFTLNTGVNYIIMLVVMLYNVYLFIAVIIGITLGYFLFGPIKYFYKLESITEKQQTITVCEPGCEDPDGSTPPLLRSMGACETNQQYSCEKRFSQTQRLLEHSPSSSPDSKSLEETNLRVTDEKAIVHSRKRSIEDTENVAEPAASCCKEPKSVTSCCVKEKEDNDNPKDHDFKTCSDKRNEME